MKRFLILFFLIFVNEVYVDIKLHILATISVCFLLQARTLLQYVTAGMTHRPQKYSSLRVISLCFPSEQMIG